MYVWLLQILMAHCRKPTRRKSCMFSGEHGSPSKDLELLAQVYVNAKENIGVFIDHIGVVQKCSSRSGINTFGHLLTCISQFVFSAFREGSLVALIADRSDSKLSIKAGERKQHGCLSNSPEVIVNSEDQVLLRNMKAYFANPKNKDDLNSFVFSELESLAQQVLRESQTLVLAGGFSDHERVVSVSSGKKEDSFEVFSDQQEAGTRIMLQISDCIKRIGISTAIVWSPDTDVFILSAHISCKFGIDIWFKTGNKTNTRFIPVHSISQSIGHEISSCLIPFHALTGCNSTSLKGIGKKKAFKVLKRKLKDISKLKELGDNLELPDELIRTGESFICQLFVPDSKNNDTNMLRCKTFCRSSKQNHLLSPCKNSLFQHLQRSNYQAYVWKML